MFVRNTRSSLVSLTPTGAVLSGNGRLGVGHILSMGVMDPDACLDEGCKMFIDLPFWDVKHPLSMLIDSNPLAAWSSRRTFHQPSCSVNTRSGSVSLTEFYAVVEVPVGGHLGTGQHPSLYIILGE